MEDPHVIELSYRLVIIESGLEFKDPAPTEWETESALS